jgi:hypothetical protein
VPQDFSTIDAHLANPAYSIFLTKFHLVIFGGARCLYTVFSRSARGVLYVLPRQLMGVEISSSFNLRSQRVRRHESRPTDQLTSSNGCLSKSWAIHRTVTDEIRSEVK